MKEYGRQVFDQCLRAIVGELEAVEDQHQDWPCDMVWAASIISRKAEKLLDAAVNHRDGKSRFREEVLVEAAQTGALILKFLLAANEGFDSREETEVAIYGY